MKVTQIQQVSHDQLRAALDPKTIDAEKREFEVVVSTGARAPMAGVFEGEGWVEYDEELEISESACDTSRIRAGACPLIDSHGMGMPSLDDQIGTVLETWIVRGELRARCRFSADPKHAGKWADVQAGVIRSVSPRYRVAKYKDITGPRDKKRVLLATKWQIREVSLVPIPADEAARVRAASTDNSADLEAGAFHNEDPTMPEIEKKAQQDGTPAVEPKTDDNTRAAPAPAPAAPPARHEPAIDPAVVRAALEGERARMASIQECARTLRLDDPEGQTVTQKLINEGVSIETARSALVYERARRDTATLGTAIVSVGVEERTKVRAALTEALDHRTAIVVDGAKVKPLSDGAREFRTMSLLRMAEECVERAGYRTRGMGPDDLLSRALAHTSSDFPLLLADVFNKRLRDGYDQAPQTWRVLGRRSDLADFKTRNVVNIGEAPALDEVLEHGEIKRGTTQEGREQYALKTYAKIVGITRKALINDDTSAFDRIAPRFGRQAAEVENNVVWGLITANPTMGDGIALFNGAPPVTATSHGNLGAGVIAIGSTSTGLTQALYALRRQMAMDMTTPLNLQPAYLIVPASLEVLAKQFQTSLTPAQPSNANPFIGTFRQVIVEPRLDANSATAWYVTASPDQVDMIEYAYLRGQEGVFIEQRTGFEVDGLEIKARHDFGAGVIDYRGFYKSTGA